MGTLRIQVYTDPDTKRRIELAAAKRRQAVTDYCLDAIKEQLAEDDVLETESVEIPIKLGKYDALIAELRDGRAHILADRGGELIDVDAIIDQLREERDDELTSVYRRESDCSDPGS